jgi:hypothetical protein
VLKIMLILYRYLLRLYPTGYRDEFADEMTSVFLEVQRSTREAKLFTRAVFCLREIKGLSTGALQEHLRIITGHNRISLRRLPMQREYRFPKSATVLMSLSLLAVVLAMSKANTIVVQVGKGFPRPPVLWSVSYVVVPACFAVAIGLGILFALRRSGVQRLERLQSWPAQK